MNLSIVIVSWNVQEKLRECLRSVGETTNRHPERSEGSLAHASNFADKLRDSSPPTADQNDKLLKYDVFVVDNASKDDSAQMVEKEFPWVHLIANNFNAGFAKANNQAIRLSQGRYVLLLNPDMRVFPGTLDGMVRFMDEERNAKVGLAGCHLVSPRHPERSEGSLANASGADKLRDSSPSAQNDYITVPQVRRFPRFADQLAIMLKVPHLFPRVLDAYMMKDFDYAREARVDSIRGSFFMIRRELLDRIGLLDEGFFIWFEEVDFCKRAIAAGYEVAYTPTVKCVDYVGQSFKQVRLYPKQKMMTRSLLYYFKKHAPPWQYRILWCLRPLALAAVWVGDKLNIKARRVT